MLEDKRRTNHLDYENSIIRRKSMVIERKINFKALNFFDFHVVLMLIFM